MNEDENEQLHPEELRQEYEAQFFGFNTFSVIDRAYDTKGALVDEAVLMTYKTLMSKKYENIDKDVIRKGCEGLRDDIMKSLDKISDKLEVYLLSNILNIPKTVLLPEDTVQQDEKLRTVDESALDENIEKLQMQIRNLASSIVNSYKENAQLDSLLNRCQNTLGLLETCFKDAGIQQLDSDIEACKAKSSSLLDNMNSLEPMIMNSDSGFYDAD